MADQNEFQNQRFLTLETYRKNGTPVPTPLGFVPDDQGLVALTLEGTAKVRRIRNNPRARVVPSDGRGTPLGDWRDATAHVLDAGETKRVRKLIIGKYGLIWRALEVMNSLRHLRSGGARWVGIRITPE